MASERNLLQALVAQWRRESEAEPKQTAQRERWRWQNERIRGRHRTPKAQRPVCGARCRDGSPCQAKPVWDHGRDQPKNGRCRMHGGLSTGPKSGTGQARAQEAAKQGGLVSAQRRRGLRGRPVGTRVQPDGDSGESRRAVRVIVIHLETDVEDALA